MAAHYEKGFTHADWNFTTNVGSLLLQKHVLPIWKELITARYGEGAKDMSELNWSQPEAGQYIKKLKQTIAEDELRLLLSLLLEAGLPKHRDSDPSMAYEPLTLPDDMRDASDFTSMLTGFRINQSHTPLVEMMDISNASGQGTSGSHEDLDSTVMFTDSHNITTDPMYVEMMHLSNVSSQGTDRPRLSSSATTIVAAEERLWDGSNSQLGTDEERTSPQVGGMVNNYYPRHGGHLSTQGNTPHHHHMLGADETHFDASANDPPTTHFQAPVSSFGSNTSSLDALQQDHFIPDDELPALPYNPTPALRKSWRKSWSGSIHRMLHRG
ncbi:hypothetical protein LTR08_002128 [Meristemomyces frigidus]|nr:hypothetical protein LTR08_002128 [Meristemomyces frigidus]